jgi:hypothetical protein
MALANQLAGLTNAIDDAIAAIERGETVELEGLDAEVETVCTAAAAAPAGVRDATAGLLELMIDRLEVLANALRAQFEEEPPEPEPETDASRRARAKQAYGQK